MAKNAFTFIFGSTFLSALLGVVAGLPAYYILGFDPVKSVDVAVGMAGFFGLLGLLVSAFEVSGNTKPGTVR